MGKAPDLKVPQDRDLLEEPWLQDCEGEGVLHDHIESIWCNVLPASSHWQA